MIKTLFVEQEEMCQAHCFMNEICQSINVSPQLNNRQWRCELNDASGLENLNDEAGQVYYFTKVSKKLQPAGSGKEVDVFVLDVLFLDH